MPKYNVIDALEAFLASDDCAVKIDISKYASMQSAYLTFYSCIQRKRIKGCHLHTYKESLYLIKD